MVSVSECRSTSRTEEADRTSPRETISRGLSVIRRRQTDLKAALRRNQAYRLPTNATHSACKPQTSALRFCSWQRYPPPNQSPEASHPHPPRRSPPSTPLDSLRCPL